MQDFFFWVALAIAAVAVAWEAIKRTVAPWRWRPEGKRTDVLVGGIALGALLLIFG